MIRKRMKTSPPSGQIQRVLFAAKVRSARAVLGWSQTELGKRIGLTQRAIYRIENAAAQPRESTELRIHKAFADAGVQFEQLSNSGFKMAVPGRVLHAVGRNCGRRHQHD